jgi:uncharacterized protein (UPF0332 family)
MNFEELERNGLIGKTRINLKQIYNFLSRSKKDILTAKATLVIDKEWSYAIAYHALLRAGRALLLSFGYRPKGKDQHKTIILSTSIAFGGELEDLIRQFDRMRRKRHDFIYELDRPIPKQEAEKALADTEKLIKEIWKFVSKKDPQKTPIIDF